MKLKHLFFRIMVYTMKYMTRYLNFIAIPVVRFIASKEVIACGLRSNDGDVNIIFTPTVLNVKYSFFRKKRKKWIKVKAFSIKKFSEPIVHQYKIPDAKINQIYRVYSNNKKLRSPEITIKKNSIDLSKIINVKKLNNRLKISWKKAESYDPMIYFLAVENDKKKTVSAVYTRENYWIYPLIKTASLSLINNPPRLDKSKVYHIKLVLVDFDGWVKGMGSKTFNLSRKN